MSKEAIESALTEGLLTGFTKGNTERIDRNGFSGKGSIVPLDGGQYIDQYFGKESGGGQELVEVDGKRFTRLYAGGVVPASMLRTLGITHQEVMNFLGESLVALGESTRLFKDSSYGSEKGWNYQYKIISRDDLIGVTSGIETICYIEDKVFAHHFVLSPVK